MIVLRSTGFCSLLAAQESVTPDATQQTHHFCLLESQNEYNTHQQIILPILIHHMRYITVVAHTTNMLCLYRRCAHILVHDYLTPKRHLAQVFRNELDYMPYARLNDFIALLQSIITR
jgi:hypothetical protein